MAHIPERFFGSVETNGGTSKTKKTCLWPLGWSVARRALPNLDIGRLLILCVASSGQ